MADNSAAGRKVCKQKLPDLKPRRKPTVSREHLVAIVPPVRVLDRVRIDVPAVVVPVHVDRAVILSDDLGQSQNDLLTILLDEGYMQIVREKLSLLPTKRKNSKSRNLAQNSRVFCPV